MKTIGLIGGMSWESTQLYYQLINQGIAQKLGGLHSAEILMASVDFAPLAAMQTQGDWDAIAEALAARARCLEQAGADVLLLCTNTMHKVADALLASVSIPLLHIVDSTAAAVRSTRLKKVALLGTAFTMEEEFYRSRLASSSETTVLVPDPTHRQNLHRIIFDELCRGIIRPESVQLGLNMISELEGQGAEAVILGCTELGLLIGPEDVKLPIFDTCKLHAFAAVDFALAL